MMAGGLVYKDGLTVMTDTSTGITKLRVRITATQENTPEWAGFNIITKGAASITYIPIDKQGHQIFTDTTKQLYATTTSPADNQPIQIEIPQIKSEYIEIQIAPRLGQTVVADLLSVKACIDRHGNIAIIVSLLFTIHSYCIIFVCIIIFAMIYSIRSFL